MNNKTCALLVAFLGLTAPALLADPMLDSWLTTYSGKYARLYATDADKTSGNAISTWSKGSISQTVPAYCGIYYIANSASWVYVRASGLACHVMGPWYLNAGHTTTFPNYPKFTGTLFRFPRSSSIPTTKTLTGLGAIGFFVDGVAMFDSRDAFYWNGTSETSGSGNWNRDAWVNESVTFDPGQAHQPGDGTHHYHANPIALRYLMGDHVDFNSTNKNYSEYSADVAKHSPILAWVRDGYPVYGPYGYANPTNSASGIRRMVSGYVLRNGQNGSQNLTVVGRTNIPAWAVRLYNVSAAQSGPSVSTTYPLGRYMEDNEYLGDLGYIKGIDFDLDEYNVRYCVTPEFPNGTYAYFVSIGTNGLPAFPYNIGRAYFGNPTGNTVTSISEPVTTNFVGGSSLSMTMAAPSVNKTSGDVTLTWSSVEGGSYVVSSTTNLTTWTTNATTVTASGITASLTETAIAKTNANRFYRVTRAGLPTTSN